MTKKRTRVAGIVAGVAAIPFLLPTVAGATAGPGYVGSSPDPASYPPLPSQCAGQQWWQWVYDPETETVPPTAQVLSASNPYIVLDLANVPAGEVTITEAITWDARLDQRKVQPAGEGDEGAELAHHNKPERWEKLRVEFYKDGQLIGVSPLHTPDLPDDNPFAWSVSSLGTLDLYEDADTVKLAHASTFMETDGRENAFFPKSICITSKPFVPDPDASLTYSCDAGALTMVNKGKGWSEFSYGIDDEWKTVWLGPGESLVEELPIVEDGEVYVELWIDGEQVIAELIETDCVTPTTVTLPPASEPPTEVLAQTEQAPELAFTGGESVRNAAIGAALLAAGAGMLIVSRRREAGEA